MRGIVANARRDGVPTSLFEDLYCTVVGEERWCSRSTENGQPRNPTFSYEARDQSGEEGYSISCHDYFTPPKSVSFSRGVSLGHGESCRLKGYAMKLAVRCLMGCLFYIDYEDVI